MNEQIAILKERATEDILGVKILNAEKFALSIIKQCVEICEKGTSTQTSSAGSAIMIKNYFGVSDENF